MSACMLWAGSLQAQFVNPVAETNPELRRMTREVFKGLMDELRTASRVTVRDLEAIAPSGHAVPRADDRAPPGLSGRPENRLS